MASRRHHARLRRAALGDAAPALLPTFFAATLIMVVAVVLMARSDSDVADGLAFALLLVTAGGLMAAIRRQLRDDGSDDDR